MSDVAFSTKIRTSAAQFARAHGYAIHHDIAGWYVIAPYEREPATGYSLGFDGRKHFDLCADAWRRAQTLAERRARR